MLPVGRIMSDQTLALCWIFLSVSVRNIRAIVHLTLRIRSALENFVV